MSQRRPHHQDQRPSVASRLQERMRQLGKEPNATTLAGMVLTATPDTMLDQPQLIRILAGQRRPSLLDLRDLSKALDCTMAYLAGVTHAPDQDSPPVRHVDYRDGSSERHVLANGIWVNTTDPRLRPRDDAAWPIRAEPAVVND